MSITRRVELKLTFELSAADDTEFWSRLNGIKKATIERSGDKGIQKVDVTTLFVDMKEG
jgi:hypothetical protein